MYGYIYKTTNLVNNKVYIGKKESPVYVPTYYGSGKIIRRAIERYGASNFKNEILDTAMSKKDLNDKEKQYITYYKEQLGDDCYNIASGGDGGNVIAYLSEQDKADFVDKMTSINKARCNTDDFKLATSKRSKLMWQDDNFRKRVTEGVKASWTEAKRDEQRQKQRLFYTDPENRARSGEFSKLRWKQTDARQKFREQMKEVWTETKRHKHSQIIRNATTELTLQKRSVNAKKLWESEDHRNYMSERIRQVRLSESINRGAEARKTKVLMKFKNEEIVFGSRIEFERYCLDRFGYTFSAKTYKKLLTSGEAFKSYYKKQQHMDGIQIYNV